MKQSNMNLTQRFATYFSSIINWFVDILVFVTSINHPYSVWIMTRKTDKEIQKDCIFRELYQECKHADCESGLSSSLFNKLNSFSFEEKKEIVSRKREGCTPLFIACMKGNLNILLYLIKECGADVEEKGIYELPTDRSNHYVSPLWCASVLGNLKIVKALIEHGADVNSESDTGSTPVRSSCFMNHYDVVSYLIEHGANILKPNHNGGTCLINSVQNLKQCELLVKNGADINVKDCRMKTALHYAIEEIYVSTTFYLLQCGADIHIKSKTGDDALQTACLKMATPIFDYLIKYYNYSPERIADAYELMGSTFFEEKHDTTTALRYWRTALLIRYKDAQNPIKKKILPARYYYSFAIEFQTMDELDNISLDLDNIRIQSLLIAERILGPYHKSMIFRLMVRGASYADNSQYQKCIDLWLYAADLRIQKDTLLRIETSFAVQTLVKLFLEFCVKQSSRIIREQLHYHDVIILMKLLVSQLNECMNCLSIRPVFEKQQESIDIILKVLTHLIYILNIIDGDKREVFKIVSKLVKIDPRDSNGNSLLHLASSRNNALQPKSPLMNGEFDLIFPELSVIELLLECGASVDSANNDGSTPLHVASMKCNYKLEIVDLLLKRGSHIDWRNSDGILPFRSLTLLSEGTINPLKYLSLACMSARAIVEYRIPYIGQVPVDLEKFIEIH